MSGFRVALRVWGLTRSSDALPEERPCSSWLATPSPRSPRAVQAQEGEAGGRWRGEGEEGGGKVEAIAGGEQGGEDDETTQHLPSEVGARFHVRSRGDLIDLVPLSFVFRL